MRLSGVLDDDGRVSEFCVQATPAAKKDDAFYDAGRLAADTAARSMLSGLTKEEEASIMLFFLYDANPARSPGGYTVVGNTLVGCETDDKQDTVTMCIRVSAGATQEQIAMARQNDTRKPLLVQSSQECEGISECAEAIEALCDGTFDDGQEAEAVLARGGGNGCR
jgi:hypothetical protein